MLSNLTYEHERSGDSHHEPGWYITPHTWSINYSRLSHFLGELRRHVSKWKKLLCRDRQSFGRPLYVIVRQSPEEKPQSYHKQWIFVDSPENRLLLTAVRMTTPFTAFSFSMEVSIESAQLVNERPRNLPLPIEMRFNLCTTSVMFSLALILANLIFANKLYAWHSWKSEEIQISQELRNFIETTWSAFPKSLRHAEAFCFCLSRCFVLTTDSWNWLNVSSKLR